MDYSVLTETHNIIIGIIIFIVVVLLLIKGHSFYLYLTKAKKEDDDLTPEERKEQNNLEWEKWYAERGLQNSDIAIQQEGATKEVDEPIKDSIIRIEVKGVEDDERAQIELGFKLSNILIDGIRHRVAVVDNLNPREFVIKKLSASNYPFVWNKSIEVERRADTLLINYRLPSVDDMPDFLEIVYKKDQPTVIAPNEKRIKELWTDISYQIALRSIYELFSAMMLYEIKAINFNGIVRSLDLATGHDSEKCIMSVIANRETFMKIDFSRVDSKQCFKRLKGVSAHDLASLTPIPPIMTLNRDDRRFVTPDNVLEGLDGADNIAAMDWKDFENLIRDLFEKEFSAKGSEVKITRASKDGGVDAVVFDPDPIRGGKIIIQAKRYTNVVGVSAVRDLYGTVHNEGAIKGILVTTSDYGSDSYNFAKDKPITLMNGANLLHLMGKHGYKARINIAEAKRTLNNLDNE